MAFMKTNSVDITVNGTTYNSLTDFGLAISNTDYLGEPVQGTGNLISVPGRSGMLDTTDEVFGGQYFSHRQIKISFGGLEDPTEWDSVISRIRNLFEGKKVQLTFATDPDWYWTGRVSIEKFGHNRSLGEFDFCIPYADPFKYKAPAEVRMWVQDSLTYTYYTIAVQGDNVPLRFTMPTDVQGTLSVVYAGVGYTFDTDSEIYLNPNYTSVGVLGDWYLTSGVWVTASYQDRSL